jgi:proline iminopeptidase
MRRKVTLEYAMQIPGLQTTSKVVDEWKYPLAAANGSGLLQVDESPDHKLYWEEYGNPRGEPVVVLHGGPGGASSPTLARFFDPQRYRVILFDQRGCGRSEPLATGADPALALIRNTTDHLVGDIDQLREALGIRGKMHLFGGSWGSTLAMVYAIRRPQNVESLILRGIFLATREDLLYMYQGNAAAYAEAPFALTAPGAFINYPEEWRAFVEIIPQGERGDMMGAYKAIFDMTPATDAERARQTESAIAWSMWEGTISNLVPNTDAASKFGEEAFALCFARLEAHYFANDVFLEPDYIIRNAAVLACIPTHIVHGRFDQVCPLTQCSRLVAALEAAGGPPATYVKTAAGHSAMERETTIALTAILDALPPMAH